MISRFLRYLETTESVFLDLAEEMAEEDHAALFGPR